MNGYDQLSTQTRQGRPTIAEASASKRSDGESSQGRDGSNRYNTSTPERRRRALSAARRSDNPADEAKVRKEINSEANSTIDALMLGLNMDGTPRRDNRVTKRGGYRAQMSVEAKGDLPPWLRDDEDDDSDDGDDSSARSGRSGRRSSRGRGSRDRQSEADITLSVCDDDGHPGMGRRALGYGPEGYEENTFLNRRGRMAESALNPQIKPRDTVNWDGYEEAELDAKKRDKLPSSSFAGPDRSYPIDTEARARSAIARVKANGDAALQRKVIAAVKRRYPDMDVEATVSK